MDYRGFTVFGIIYYSVDECYFHLFNIRMNWPVKATFLLD